MYCSVLQSVVMCYSLSTGQHPLNKKEGAFGVFYCLNTREINPTPPCLEQDPSIFELDISTISPPSSLHVNQFHPRFIRLQSGQDTRGEVVRTRYRRNCPGFRGTAEINQVNFCSSLKARIVTAVTRFHTRPHSLSIVRRLQV